MEEQNTHVQCSKQELPTPHEAVVSSASAISAVLVHVAITHYKKLRSRQTAVEWSPVHPAVLELRQTDKQADMTINHHEPAATNIMSYSLQERASCRLPLQELTWAFLTLVTCSSGPSSKKIRWRVETQRVWGTAPTSRPSLPRRFHPLRTPVAFAWRSSTYQNINSVYQTNKTENKMTGVKWGNRNIYVT